MRLALLVPLALACGAPAGVLTLSPTEDTREATESATALWGEVAAITTGPGGIPVSLVDQARDMAGNPTCGSTIFRYSGRVEVEITRSCRNRPRIVLHELGHVICGHTECHLPEGAKGVMAAYMDPKGPADVIDEPSVQVVTSP